MDYSTLDRASARDFQENTQPFGEKRKKDSKFPSCFLAFDPILLLVVVDCGESNVDH